MGAGCLHRYLHPRLLYNEELELTAEQAADAVTAVTMNHGNGFKKTTCCISFPMIRIATDSTKLELVTSTLSLDVIRSGYNWNGSQVGSEGYTDMSGWLGIATVMKRVNREIGKRGKELEKKKATAKALAAYYHSNFDAIPGGTPSTEMKCVFQYQVG